ncbi:uncharacterized protein LOC115209700 [Octopus sinensis]|nr:uncharacterized protein LOC115209700 [Octopus sinensis]
MVRRLNKGDAIKLFLDEFGLKDEQAESMFEMFDRDHNGELSLWEFHQFYTMIGNHAQDMLTLFEKLEKDEKGHIQIDAAWEAMKTMNTPSGRPLKETEIEMFLKAAAGEEKFIDLQKFVSLLCGLKLYKG